MGKKKIRLWPEGGIEVGELLRAKPQAAEGAGSYVTTSAFAVSIKNCGNYGVFGFWRVAYGYFKHHDMLAVCTSGCCLRFIKCSVFRIFLRSHLIVSHFLIL